MLYDTDTPEGRAAFDRRFDVCIIGSGPAGITIARRLAARGFDVALMEGGGTEWSEESQALAVGESVGLAYPDLDVARIRAFGGNSGHWNGLCRAFEPADMKPRPQNPGSGWPITRADLDPYAGEVAEILDLVPDSGDVPPDPLPAPEGAFEQVWYLRSAPTRFGEKYLDELTNAPKIALGVHANLVDLRLDDALSSVTAAVFKGYGSGDAGFTVTAPVYCLCTGGFENPRLLLNFDTQIPGGIGNGSGLVGRYFSDHLRMEVGEVLLTTAPTAEFRYFTPTEDFLAENQTLKVVLHIDYYDRKPLPLPKEIARTVQCSVPFGERLVEAVAGTAMKCDRGGLSDALASRDPAANPWGRVVANSEPALNPESRVTLSDTRDPLGLRRIRLDWQPLPIDDRTLHGSTVAFAGYLADRDEGRVRLYDNILSETPIKTTEPEQRLNGWHQMCTTRMSDDPATGVVDADCKVFGIDNLYVGGSSVFSSPGFQNPTYTIVELALRLGDHLADTNVPGAAAAGGAD